MTDPVNEHRQLQKLWKTRHTHTDATTIETRLTIIETAINEITTGGEGATGGAPSVVVAASNASDLSKDRADYQCDGLNDEVEIQAALDSLSVGGRILLTEGTFNINFNGTANVIATSGFSGVWLQGVGMEATILNVADSYAGVEDSLDVVAFEFTDTYCGVRDLTIQGGDGANAATAGVAVGDYGSVENVYFANDGLGIYLSSASYAVVRGNRIESGRDGIYMETSNGCVVSGNTVDFVGRHGIHVNSSNDCAIVGNVVEAAGQNTTNTFDNIFVEGSSSDNNTIARNTVRGASSAPKPRYGINVSASTCNDNTIDGNDLGDVANYGTQTYVDSGTDTQGSNFTTTTDPGSTSQVSTTTVANTVTETEIASLAIPRGFLTAGVMYRLSLWGDYLNNSGASRQVTIRTKINGTTILTATVTGIGAGADRRKWHHNVEVLGESASAQRVGAFWRMSDQTSATMSIHANSARQATGYNTAAANTNSGVITLSVTAQHGTAAATIDIRRHISKLERI